VRVDAGGGNTRRLQVCTSCIKAGKVARASRG
jgi:large subunit ribosomal protein L28